MAKAEPRNNSPLDVDIQSSTDAHDKSKQILTLANVITLIRLLLVPVAFFFLVGGGRDVVAFVLFAFAGLTDFLDGQIARRTDTVTDFGKAIDPLVDRLLLACGIIGLFIVGRLPAWMLILLLSRDFFLLFGLFVVGRVKMPEIRVRFVGKAATMALLVGFSGLILNTQMLDGLRWTHSAALPGFSMEPYSFWMWFVYLGIILSLATTVAYIVDGMHFLRQVREGDGAE